MAFLLTPSTPQGFTVFFFSRALAFPQRCLFFPLQSILTRGPDFLDPPLFLAGYAGKASHHRSIAGLQAFP